MSPSCGCCKKWVSHLENNGFEVESIFKENMRTIKSKYNIAQDQISCHTGIVGSYFIEGHVPASDIKKLLEILHTFVALGNTVVVIEHNLDVIKTADYIVDMGPEGGVKGGKIIAEGKPEEICKVNGSYTGKFLKNLLQ